LPRDDLRGPGLLHKVQPIERAPHGVLLSCPVRNVLLFSQIEMS
jgi:hypothetical protein